MLNLIRKFFRIFFLFQIFVLRLRFRDFYITLCNPNSKISGSNCLTHSKRYHHEIFNKLDIYPLILNTVNPCFADRFGYFLIRIISLHTYPAVLKEVNLPCLTQLATCDCLFHASNRFASRNELGIAYVQLLSLRY